MKVIFTIIFLILYFSFTSLYAQIENYSVQGMQELEESLSKRNEALYIQQKKENNQLRKDIAKLYLAYFGEEWGGLNGSSWGSSNPLSPKPTVRPSTGETPALSTTDIAEAEENARKSLAEDYDLRIASLNEQLRDIVGQLRAMTALRERELQTSTAVIDSINGVNDQLKSTLAKAEQALERALIEAKKNQLIIDCASAFYQDNKIKRNDAQSVLEKARAKYTRYAEIKGRNNNRYDAEIREHLDFIFDTYETYDDQPVLRDCGEGMIVKDVISFMDARDHLNLANILAADPRHLINRYDGGIDQRTAAINADLIYHLSQVFSKQNSFSDLSMSKKIAENLPDLMQKVPNALASSSSLNARDSTDRKIQDLYADVAYEFKEKRYASALGIYNRYQRLEGESHLMKNNKVRAATMTSVGIILLFDLGNVGDARGIPLKGTFLEKVFNSQQREGIKLLKQVLSFRDKDGSLYPRKSEVFEWQQRAAYAMSKYYYPAGKQERQRNREIKRINSGKKLKQGQIEIGAIEDLEVEQAKPRRLIVTPSFYPYRPLRQNYYQNNGEVGIELDGSGLEGGAQLAYYKPGKAFTYGVDLGYSQQYYRLDNNSIRLPPSSLSFGTAFAGPFMSYAARNIEKQFHPILSAGLSFRYDIDRKFRLNDNNSFGDRRSILITNLPFFNRTSWYANVGAGFNRERFSLSKQRMVASTFRVFAFLPIFNAAIQVNNDPDAFVEDYSQNFLDLGRQTIHLGFTYSKMIEVFKNGLGMNGKEMLFVNNRKKKVRLLQPVVNNNAPRKKIDGRFTLMTSMQNKVDSVYLPEDSSYVNMDYSMGWRAAYSLRFLGNNVSFYNQNNGYPWKKFPLYDFYVTGGIQQQLYRLSIREQYRSFRSLHGFLEGGARLGSNRFMVLFGGGYNFPFSSQAVYTSGEGVINKFHSIYAFAGIQLTQFMTIRVSTRSLDIDSSEKVMSFKTPSLQVGFGF